MTKKRIVLERTFDATIDDVWELWTTKEGFESWWAPVVSPNAGKDRGQLMVPQVEDSVLVGFEQGDVRFPYVLGSVFTSQ